jgi:hypothetical protein
MHYRLKYAIIGLLMSLATISCQPTTTAHEQTVAPTQLVAQVNRGKISGNMEGQQLANFAKKLVLKQALDPSRKQLSKAKLTDAYLELSGNYVYLISDFTDQQTGNNIKVATELQRQTNSASTYAVSL